MHISKYKQRKAFTLIEVLISIGLLGIVLVALFSTVSMMRDSNEHLHGYLQKAKKITKATKVLYLDILSSDGQINIKKDEFSQVCIESTHNSLYGLSLAKVCWVVLKKNNTLARVEGNAYSLPTRFEDRVEVNKVMKNIELFDVYHQKDKVLVLLKQVGSEPITFLVQGVLNPVLKILPNGTKIMRDGRKILSDGTQILKDGSKILPDGTVIPSKKANKPNIERQNNVSGNAVNGNQSRGQQPRGVKNEQSPEQNTIQPNGQRVKP